MDAGGLGVTREGAEGAIGVVEVNNRALRKDDVEMGCGCLVDSAGAK